MSKTYVPNTWVNGEAPPINATNLNNIENGTIVNSRNDLSITHDMTSDADYTLTDAQNQYGKIEITDTDPFLTTGRNIIVNTDEHTFLFVNSTVQTLTVKTSAGTGIAIPTNEARELRNDGTNVIVYEQSIKTIGGESIFGDGNIDISGGKVLQVVSVDWDDLFSTTSATPVDITGATLAITPTLATSKVLVIFDVAGAKLASNIASVDLVRNGSKIQPQASAGNRATSFMNWRDAGTDRIPIKRSATYLDSPASTSLQTYKLQGYVTGGETFYINRSVSDADDTSHARGFGTITLMEIGV